MKKILMKGNEAIARSAILGGCEAFFGYPITPQNEIPEYLSKHLLDAGRVFVQAESEVASINMVYGAAATGARVMTSSSSPGIALMQEGISYLCGAELPCVLVNVMRGGPGLGGIQPSQSDYFQITRGGGNGDYRVLSYAPENLQELVDIMKTAFDTALYYRNPVMIAVDGLIGQMMEAVDLYKEVEKRELPMLNWAATGGHTGKERRIVNSLYLDPKELENHNLDLEKKYNRMKANEQKYELINCEDAEFVIIAYGTMARIARSALEILKEKGLKVGLFKPITLWPFPEEGFKKLNNLKGVLVAELSLGQMLDDVQIVNQGRYPLDFFGRVGGMLPEPEEIVEALMKLQTEVDE
ncbi:MAG: 3-methyl-2-oxobutanoate dehydrogenase subunit VorB [Bacilli bacterium]|nr:3-methyl-2-oxobutanoate dehydrogenase subunit VorB [Bacilli bacterium]